MQTYEFEEETNKRPAKREKGKIHRLIDKFAGLVKAGKFAAGSAIGFLDTEIILLLGSYLLYGKLGPPQSASSSPSFWALNAVAFGVGVTIAFFVNEMLIFRNEERTRHQIGLWNIIERLVKFQLIFLTGNLIIVVVQLLLLKEFSVPPYFGNIIGAIVSFPASYFCSMHLVWSSREIHRNFVETQRTSIARSSNEDDRRIIEAQKVLRRFPAFSNGNYEVKVNEYKLDLIPRKENETLIDFALNLVVITQDSEN